MRRVSRRRYLVRRAGAVVVVVAVGFGAIGLAGSLAGGDDEAPATAAPIPAGPTTAVLTEPPSGGGAAGDAAAVLADATTTLESVPDRAATASPDRRSVDGGDERAPVGPTSTEPGSAAVDETTATAPPETAPEPPPSTVPASTVPAPPTAEDPAQVLVIGDSFAGLWGPPLEDLLEASGVMRVEIDHEASTGLARPRRYDWFGRAREQLAAVQPDVVVTSFGGNDFVPLGDGDGAQVVGDPVANEVEWLAEYQRRAGEMMDLLAQDGRVVIWVGTANHPDPTTSAGLALQDRAAKAAAAQRPHVVVVDTWNLFAGRSGGWAPYVIDPRDNRGVDVRMEDGFHPNPVGAELLAAQIDPAIRAALRL